MNTCDRSDNKIISSSENPERGHGPWPGAGADLGLVLAVEGVADLVQGPDGPLPADEPEQGGGVGAARQPGC